MISKEDKDIIRNRFIRDRDIQENTVSIIIYDTVMYHIRYSDVSNVIPKIGEGIQK
jgi:hypothetical protein